jgi:signal peptide peptidase SppA
MNALLRYIQQQTWAMEPAVLRSFCEVLDRHVAGQKLAREEIAQIVAARDERTKAFRAMHDDAGPSEDEPYMLGSVAVIPVCGVIAPHASMVNGMSQPRGIDCATLCRRLDEAAASMAARSILLHVDSPGGAVAGLSDVVARVRAVNEQKPVIAIANDCMASAAYWISSQAREIYATPIAMVGSIGVYNVVEDTSEAYAKQGVKRYLVRAGERKGGGADGIKVEQEDLDEMTAVAVALRQVFVSDVARGRGLDQARVLSMAEGLVWVGAEAQQMGLINGVRLAGDLAAEMHERFGLSSNRIGAGAAAARPGIQIAAKLPEGAQAMKLSELKEKYPDAMQEHEEEVRAKVKAESEEEKPEDPPAAPAPEKEQDETAAAATLPQLKAAFPGEKAFWADCLDRNLTLAQAQAERTKQLTAEVEDLKKQLGDAQADQPRFAGRGVEPIKHSPAPARAGSFAQSVKDIVANDKCHLNVAMARAAKLHPEQHRAWLEAGCPAIA